MYPFIEKIKRNTVLTMRKFMDFGKIPENQAKSSIYIEKHRYGAPKWGKSTKYTEKSRCTRGRRHPGYWKARNNATCDCSSNCSSLELATSSSLVNNLALSVTFFWAREHFFSASTASNGSVQCLNWVILKRLASKNSKNV